MSLALSLSPNFWIILIREVVSMLDIMWAPVILFGLGWWHEARASSAPPRLFKWGFVASTATLVVGYYLGT